MIEPPDPSSPDDEGEGRRLDTDAVTWAALMGRWVAFARSATALPDDADGRRVRAVVADIIMLQAVWMALGELDELPPGERALGLDRAELLIEQHAAAIHAQWPEGPPHQLVELETDARQRLAEQQRRHGRRGHDETA